MKILHYNIRRVGSVVFYDFTLNIKNTIKYCTGAFYEKEGILTFIGKPDTCMKYGQELKQFIDGLKCK